MKSLIKSVKHTRYVMGSLAAVMFAVGGGGEPLNDAVGPLLVDGHGSGPPANSSPVRR